MNNVITASRLGTFVRCMRQHFWSYEIGLRRTDEAALPLRFGSAWARAMEARWQKKSYEQALAYAIPEGVDLALYDCATLAALLAAYYDVYGPIEDFAQVNAEEQFEHKLDDGFTAKGKIDGLGTLNDGRNAIIENKTTGDSVDEHSQYWLRLRFNTQILQYVDAANESGWDVHTVIYDVTRKPSIKPKQVVDLDKSGKKIVLDRSGKRVFKDKAKKIPRESAVAKDGMELKSHLETPDEYCDRLHKDALARPAFYFARREMPILDDQLEAFRKQRRAIGMLVIAARANEFAGSGIGQIPAGRDPEAWPRHVDKNVCGFCIYADMCLSGNSIDLNRLPNNFKVQNFNPELEEINDTPEEITADSAAVQ